MTLREIVHRMGDGFRKIAWRRRWRASVAETTRSSVEEIRFRTSACNDVIDAVRRAPEGAKTRVLRQADAIIAGNWSILGITHHGIGDDPSWFIDPESGMSAPSQAYAFDVPVTNAKLVGDIKNIWELSRHQHLTILATAFAISGNDVYAKRVAQHISSWLCANQFLNSVHWTSGIELGVRLISWVWSRRLLEGWAGASTLFEHNPLFIKSLGDHLEYLRAFVSVGSSSNNHLTAELVGRLVAVCAFEGTRWDQDEPSKILKLITNEIQRQTFPDGLNREMAFEYHGFVLELYWVAICEAASRNLDIPSATLPNLCRQTDAIASLMDAQGGMPRYGDSDDAHGLLLDDSEYNRWNSLLNTGSSFFASADWWPHWCRNDIRSEAFKALAPSLKYIPEYSRKEPGVSFNDAGVYLIKWGKEADEIWCRCDSGPLGFLKTGAHGHADALSIELRVGGQEILVDPGTYCYHKDLHWREYFRSTRAHNTVELCLESQSLRGGPFLWTRHANSETLKVDVDPTGRVICWNARHDGYQRKYSKVYHEREVRFLCPNSIRVRDHIYGHNLSLPFRLHFHLHPEINVSLHEFMIRINWNNNGQIRRVSMHLDQRIEWRLAAGEMDPILGWYSPAFNKLEPTNVLVGEFLCHPDSGYVETLIETDC
tara:strand:- start:3173 stop:5140 length:1968 start_codon:yes stop_codon:yes gene_type:complete